MIAGKTAVHSSIMSRLNPLTDNIVPFTVTSMPANENIEAKINAVAVLTWSISPDPVVR